MSLEKKEKASSFNGARNRLLHANDIFTQGLLTLVQHVALLSKKNQFIILTTFHVEFCCSKDCNVVFLARLGLNNCCIIVLIFRLNLCIKYGSRKQLSYSYKSFHIPSTHIANATKIWKVKIQCFNYYSAIPEYPTDPCMIIEHQNK